MNRTVPELIASAADITPDWISAVLASAGLTDPVADVEVTRVGAGQLGECHRVILGFEGPHHAGPDSVLVKLPSRDSQSLAMAAATNVYAIEVSFYRDLAPFLAIATPAVYFAAHTDDKTGFVLVLEDLTPAIQRDQLEGATEGEAELAVAEAAALHASSWDSPMLGSPELHAPAVFWGEVVKRVPTLVTAFCERYQDALDADVEAACARLAEEAPRWVSLLEGPRCLWHGDYRLDNMLLNGDRPLVVIDWQTLMPGPGTADVSYFLGSSLEYSSRRRLERDLVRTYHNRLVTAGVADYEWKQCWTDYRAHAVHGLLLTMMAAVGVEQTARGDDLFLTMARRQTAQIRDNDSFAALPADI